MQQIQLPTYIQLQCESKSEREIILQLAVAVRTMVHNSEGLAKYTYAHIVSSIYSDNLIVLS